MHDHAVLDVRVRPDVEGRTFVGPDRCVGGDVDVLAEHHAPDDGRCRMHEGARCDERPLADLAKPLAMLRRQGLHVRGPARLGLSAREDRANALLLVVRHLRQLGALVTVQPAVREVDRQRDDEPRHQVTRDGSCGRDRKCERLELVDAVEVEERLELEEPEADDAEQSGEGSERNSADLAAQEHDRRGEDHGVEDRGEAGLAAALHVHAASRDDPGDGHAGEEAGDDVGDPLTDELEVRIVRLLDLGHPVHRARREQRLGRGEESQR